MEKIFKYILVHRIAKNIEVVFSNHWHSAKEEEKVEEDVLETAFRGVLGSAAKTAVISQVKIGKVVKTASTYCEIIQRELSLKFKIKMTNPSKETNCLAFSARVLKVLDLSVSNLAILLKKQITTEDWDDDFADLTCVMLDLLLGNKTVGDEKYGVSVLNTLISDEAMQAMTEALARYAM